MSVCSVAMRERERERKVAYILSKGGTPAPASERTP
jgi:hypothetical protein